MKSKNIILSCLLALLVLVIPSRVFAAPAYQNDFYKLNIEIENFFDSYDEYISVSHCFLEQKTLTQSTSYFSEDLHNIGDLHLGWYGGAGSFSNPGITLDEYGVKMIEFNLDYEDESFSSQAADFLQTIFPDLILRGQIVEIMSHYSNFKNSREILYKDEIRLINDKKADIYFHLNKENDKLHVNVVINLKDREKNLLHQGMVYYSLAVKANQIFADSSYSMLLYPDDVGEEMYVLTWNSENSDTSFGLAFLEGPMVSMNYVFSVGHEDEIKENLNSLFRQLSPQYFSGEILEIIDWLVERCVLVNEPVIWEEDNSFFILMLFPVEDSIRVYVIFDYVL